MNKYQAEALQKRGLSEKFVRDHGVQSVTEVPPEFAGHPYASVPALMFPRENIDGSVTQQLRPDSPVENPNGSLVKYVFPVGTPMGLSVLREAGNTALVVEGTCQSLAALRYAPAGYAVYGIEGCWNWRNGELKIPASGLEVFEDRRVIIALDADAATNRLVYDAGMALKAALDAEGAAEVVFMRLPGCSGNAGLDDVLGAKSEERRAPYLKRLLSKTTQKPADAKPTLKKPQSPPQAGSKTPVPATDLEVSDAWLDRYGDTLRYNISLQKWMAYTGGVWSIDAGISLAQATFQDCIRDRIVAVKSENGQDLDAKEWLFSAKRIDAVLKQGGANRRYQVSDEILDTNPWLWNAANCLIDLRTGRQLDHAPEHYVSQQSPVVYDPAAGGRLFRAWIADVLPNRETRRFVQRVLGQAMVGSVLEHIFPVFIGTGRNGKGTLLRLVAEVFGPYFTGLKKTVLVDTKFEGHATALATLQRKRLAATEEMKATAAYDVALIKSLTGGDHITANRMRQDDVVFKPSHTMLLASNHRPKVDQEETAFWARYREVPFKTIFENPSDSVEQAMKSREELSGILNWLLEGLDDYRKNGLGEPDEVMWASAEAKVASDPLYEFISDHVVRTGDDEDWIRASVIREVYEQFCVKRRVEPVKARGFRELFAEASGGLLRKVRAGDQTLWAFTGVRQATEEDSVPLSATNVPRSFEDVGTAKTPPAVHKPLSVPSVPSVPSKMAHISTMQNKSSTESFSQMELIEGENGVNEGTNGVSAGHPGFSSGNSEGTATSARGTKGVSAGQPWFSSPDLSLTAPMRPEWWREHFPAASWSPPVCDHCSSVHELVPPAMFWYACRECFPATFERTA